jgi:GT2 family glycosyltransferase
LANPDVELSRASVRRLCEKMLPLERTAIACGPLMGEDGTPQTAFQLRPLPTWRGVLRDVLFIDELAAWLRPSGGVSQGRPSEAPAELEGVEVEQPAAAFWLLRTAAWRDVGGFDEAFHPAWFEDVDFCRRLRSAGWAIRYFTDCPVLHRGGLSLETLSHREFVASYYGNLLKYLKKHHARAYPWLWLPVKAGTWARLCGIRRR